MVRISKLSVISIPKGLRMYEFNKYIESGRATSIHKNNGTKRQILPESSISYVYGNV